MPFTNHILSVYREITYSYQDVGQHEHVQNEISDQQSNVLIYSQSENENVSSGHTSYRNEYQVKIM